MSRGPRDRRPVLLWVDGEAEAAAAEAFHDMADSAAVELGMATPELRARVLADVPRDPGAIAAALADMLGQEALPAELEAEVVGRALAALALGQDAPDAYIAGALEAARRELVAAALGQG